VNVLFEDLYRMKKVSCLMNTALQSPELLWRSLYFFKGWKAWAFKKLLHMCTSILA
jgi:hypothetical protein